MLHGNIFDFSEVFKVKISTKQHFLEEICLQKAFDLFYCLCYLIEFRMTDCILISFTFCLQVSIIQPGNYARSTNIQPPVSAEEIWNELSEEEKAVYNKEYVQERANFFNNILSEGSPNGNEVVDAMVDALMSPAPKARYMVARLKEKALVLVCALFPTAVMDFFLSYALSKVKLTQPALVSFSDSGQATF